MRHEIAQDAVLIRDSFAIVDFQFRLVGERPELLQIATRRLLVNAGKPFSAETLLAAIARAFAR